MDERVTTPASETAPLPVAETAAAPPAGPADAPAPDVPDTPQNNVQPAADGVPEQSDAPDVMPDSAPDDDAPAPEDEAPDDAPEIEAPDETPDSAAPDDAAFQDLMAQAAALQADYPGFDLWTELADCRFAALLAALEAAGYPDALATAYRGVHHDDLMASALRSAVERTAARMVDSFRSGAARPAEGPGPGLTAAADPAHMTPRQIEEVRRRVMMGQKVSF